MKATACLRERPADTVPVRVISRDEFAAQLLREPTPEAELQKRAEEQRAFELLGLENGNEQRGEAVLNLVSTVGAYYTSGEDEVVILEDGEPLNSAEHVTLLAHEFAHALQWRHSPPDQASYLTIDQALAGLAMSEGDAAWTQDRLYGLSAGRDPDEVDWPRIHRKWTQFSELQYLSQRSRVRLASRFFIYAFGARYLKDLFDEGGQAALDQAVSAPPSSTLEVIRRQSFDLATDLRLVEESGIPRVPGADRLLSERLGWWILSRGSLLGSALRLEGLLPEDLDWRGDLISLWARQGDREPLVSLRLQFATDDQAQRMLNALLSLTERQGSLHWIVTRTERSLAIFAASDLSWLGELAASPPVWGLPPDDETDSVPPAPSAQPSSPLPLLLCPVPPGD